MPLFDYHCESCGHSFTELRKVSEKDEPIGCSVCSSMETSRQVTGCAVQGTSGGSSGFDSAPTGGGGCTSFG